MPRNQLLESTADIIEGWANGDLDRERAGLAFANALEQNVDAAGPSLNSVAIDMKQSSPFCKEMANLHGVTILMLVGDIYLKWLSGCWSVTCGHHFAELLNESIKEGALYATSTIRSYHKQW